MNTRPRFSLVFSQSSGERNKVYQKHWWRRRVFSTPNLRVWVQRSTFHSEGGVSHKRTHAGIVNVHAYTPSLKPDCQYLQGLYWYVNTLEQDDDGSVADAFYVEKPPAVVWVSLISEPEINV